MGKTTGKYGVLVLNTGTGQYKVASVHPSRYDASKVAQSLRADMVDPFVGIGQEMVIIAPQGR